MESKTRFRVLILLFILLLSIFDFVPFLFAALFIVFIDLVLIQRLRLSNPFKGITRSSLVFIVITAILLQIFNTAIVLLFEKFADIEINIEQFAQYKTDLKGFVILMIIVWSVGGFAEELVYRRYLLGNLMKLDFIGIKSSVIITSLIFATTHAYQDLPGIVNAFISSLIFSYIYLKYQQNLGVSILVHGIYDTLGIIVLFLLN